MQLLKVYVCVHRRELGLPLEGALFTTTLAPWRNSRTSRIGYGLRFNREVQYRLLIQDGISLCGIPLKSNPWEPSFAGQIEDLLPAHRGSFCIDSGTYHWSEFLHSESLLDIGSRDRKAFGSMIEELTTDLLRRQSSQLSQVENYIEVNQRVFHERIFDEWLKHSFAFVTEKHFGSLKGPCSCSWTHGDLWPKDVFWNGKPCIIDWEWGTHSAPFGCDSLDLYIASANALFGLSCRDAWAALFNDSISELRGVRTALINAWNRVQFEARQRQLALLFTLWRSIARVIAQEGILGADMVSQYIAVVTSLDAVCLQTLRKTKTS